MILFHTWHKPTPIKKSALLSRNPFPKMATKCFKHMADLNELAKSDALKNTNRGLFTGVNRSMTGLPTLARLLLQGFVSLYSNTEAPAHTCPLRPALKPESYAREWALILIRPRDSRPLLFRDPRSTRWPPFRIRFAKDEWR